MSERAVELWWAGAPDDRPALLGLLDPVERQRAATLRRPGVRATFVVAAALARLVLGARLGTDPRDVPIERGCPECGRPHGRPRLASGPVYSVSHTDDLVAVAISAGGRAAERAPLGVDVERVDPRRAPPVHDVLTAAEQRDTVDVWAAWVHKEAVLKATGEGLRRPMTELRYLPASGQVRFGNHATARTAELIVPPWCAEPVVGAVAVLGPHPPRVVNRDGRALLESGLLDFSACRTRPSSRRD